MRRPVAALALLVAVVAGCGAPAAEAPTPMSAAPVPPPTSAAPALTPDESSCQDFARTAATVRGVTAAAAQGPILPAAVALVLFMARDRASTPGIQDPELAAAQAELMAAIDELDAQGKAGLPPGGNPAQNPVQLDPARLDTALGEVERLCGTPV